MEMPREGSAGRHSGSTRTATILETSRNSTVEAASLAHAVTLLASQIPDFNGTKEENVRLWVQKVNKVAQIHGALDDVTLLAASNRLGKDARR